MLKLSNDPILFYLVWGLQENAAMEAFAVPCA